MLKYFFKSNIFVIFTLGNDINMKKFQLFWILFALYVYNQYIIEDWTIYTKLGKICVYPFWFIRSIIYWIISPIFIPEYLFKQSELYKQIQKIQNSPEYSTKLFKL